MFGGSVPPDKYCILTVERKLPSQATKVVV
jgi:hypothetical protein